MNQSYSRSIQESRSYYLIFPISVSRANSYWHHEIKKGLALAFIITYFSLEITFTKYSFFEPDNTFCRIILLISAFKSRKLEYYPIIYL